MIRVMIIAVCMHTRNSFLFVPVLPYCNLLFLSLFLSAALKKREYIHFILSRKCAIKLTIQLNGIDPHSSSVE